MPPFAAPCVKNEGCRLQVQGTDCGGVAKSARVQESELREPLLAPNSPQVWQSITEVYLCCSRPAPQRRCS